MEVRPADLTQAATYWRGLPETSLAAPMELPVYGDPASAAVAAAMADWPGIHEARQGQRNAAADNLVGASGYTSAAFNGADESGVQAVGGIFGSGGTVQQA